MVRLLGADIEIGLGTTQNAVEYYVGRKTNTLARKTDKELNETSASANLDLENVVATTSEYGDGSFSANAKVGLLFMTLRNLVDATVGAPTTSTSGSKTLYEYTITLPARIGSSILYFFFKDTSDNLIRQKGAISSVELSITNNSTDVSVETMSEESGIDSTTTFAPAYLVDESVFSSKNTSIQIAPTGTAVAPLEINSGTLTLTNQKTLVDIIGGKRVKDGGRFGATLSIERSKENETYLDQFIGDGSFDVTISVGDSTTGDRATITLQGLQITGDYSTSQDALNDEQTETINMRLANIPNTTPFQAQIFSVSNTL